MGKKIEIYFNGVVYSDCISYSIAVRKYCRESGCPFYYGEIDGCMYDELAVPNPNDRKCTRDMWEVNHVN